MYASQSTPTCTTTGRHVDPSHSCTPETLPSHISLPISPEAG
jgi:hypothetical protein